MKLYDGCSAFSGTSLRMPSRRCVRVDPAGCSCSSAVVFRLRSAGRGGSTRAVIHGGRRRHTRGAGGTTGRVCGGLKTRARARSRCLCTRGHTRPARAPPPPPPFLSPPSSAFTCALCDGARESAPVGHRRRPARVAGHAERQGGGRDAPPTGLGAPRRRWGRPVAVGGGRRSRGGVRRELRRAPPLA